MRRIERLINLIAALLETSRPLTADDIRRDIAGYDQANFEAFRRAFERDKEALRAMGIPLEVRPSTNDPFSEQADGYIIPKDRYYLPEPDLEPEELAALRLASDAILGGGDEATAGLMKLSVDAAMTPGGGPRVLWGADVAAEQPLLGPVYGAILDRNPISFRYGSASGSISERDVEPYALVHRRGNWYVVGRDRGRDDIRAFRLSRVEGKVTSLEGSFTVPEGFDAAAHLGGEAFEIGAEVATAVVRFEDSLRWWVDQNLPDAPLVETDGAVEVSLPVGNVDALVSWVLGFGPDATIVSPDSARSALLGHLQPLLGPPR